MLPSRAATDAALAVATEIREQASTQTAEDDTGTEAHANGSGPSASRQSSDEQQSGEAACPLLGPKACIVCLPWPWPDLPGQTAGMG